MSTSPSQEPAPEQVPAYTIDRPHDVSDDPTVFETDDGWIYQDDDEPASVDDRQEEPPPDTGPDLKAAEPAPDKLPDGRSS